jgi:hypothetical protein
MKKAVAASLAYPPVQGSFQGQEEICAGGSIVIANKHMTVFMEDMRQHENLQHFPVVLPGSPVVLRAWNWRRTHGTALPGPGMRHYHNNRHPKFRKAAELRSDQRFVAL